MVSFSSKQIMNEHDCMRKHTLAPCRFKNSSKTVVKHASKQNSSSKSNKYSSFEETFADADKLPITEKLIVAKSQLPPPKTEQWAFVYGCEIKVRPLQCDEDTYLSS